MADKNKFGLTIREEQFVKNVMSGKYRTQGDAYSDAYGHGIPTDRKKRASMSVQSAKTMARPHVKRRVEYLRAKVDEAIKEQAVVTVETMTKELEENRAVARELEQAAAMNGASNLKMKLYGLGQEKVDVSSSDGSFAPSMIKLVAPDADRDD